MLYLRPDSENDSDKESELRRAVNASGNEQKRYVFTVKNRARSMSPR